MKKNLAYALLVMLIAVTSCSFTNKTFENDDKDKLLLDLITYILERGHYQPKDINDDFSVQVFKGFLDVVDPTKRYFLESDIQEFEKYKFQLDDQIKNNDISFFDIVHQRLIKRMEEAKGIYKEILSVPFDYSVEEGLEIDYKDQGYAATEKGLKDRWRKQLKYATLGTYDSKLTYKEAGDAKKSGKDAREVNINEVDISDVDVFEDDAEDTNNGKPLTPKQAEVKARELTKTTLDDYFDFVDDLERKDWFVQYLNTIVEVFDPHTFYFAPDEKEKFDAGMSGKFEGIGARLQKKRDQTKIVEVISGGPVWRDQRLEVGDEIMKVGQDGQPPVDIVGMRLDDAIKFIKGPKGSVVDLTIKKVDGSITVISLTRDVVELEESYAKSAKIIKEDHRYGLINLPKFYVDFEDYNQRNAATDVAKEVERLKEAGAEGLILDLRDNGGGSLKTVVEMAGLFIKDGPIVQVRSTGKQAEVYNDKDERIQWDGPLVILVNELSASASEILAAAMQDYKRAVVIGSKQTFGKGTVQNVIPLESIVHGNQHGDLGAIKITTQKFYRVNGGSTQLEGVKSDVIVPDRYSYIDIGEKDQINPLEWDKISPAKYTPWNGYIDYQATIENSKKRMGESEQIKLIEENARWIQKGQDETYVSLKYEDYKKELEENKEKNKYFKTISNYDSKLTFESLKYEQQLFTKDSILREKRNRWHKDLAKDVYIEEAVNVLQDLKMNNIKNSRLASVKG
ncbi:MAG TPA: carboxy terminal-processing peptidase [Arenibacter sp.]|nr:carboxy terminal-processing peptidase [Arenibacter sp.]